jgi:hypothetical protein
MQVEIRRESVSGNIRNTLWEEQHKSVINNMCKAKGNLRSFVESRVCHLLCIGVSFEQKHAV